MKKFIVPIIACLTLVGSSAMDAKPLKKGYRGFVNLEAETFRDRKDYYLPDGYHKGKNEVRCFFGISTTQGYQFNEHLFVGAGVWLQSSSEREIENYFLSYPVYGDVRTDWTFGKVSLFGELRAGYTFKGRRMLFKEEEKGQDKIYINPNVGYRLDWGSGVAANFSFGLALHGYHDNWDGASEYHFKASPSLKIGIEF